MATNETLMSPRLAALLQDLGAGNASALEAFWQQIVEQGAPLIEPIAGDDAHTLVTFLWRASAETTNVVVVGGLAGRDGFAGNQMTRLLDTDLWFKTYRVRNDLRANYQLSPNDALTEVREVTDWEQRTASWQPDPLNPHIYVFPNDDEYPDRPGGVYSVVELPAAPPQPWITPRPDLPTGRVDLHRLHSNILASGCRVWIYTPPGYTTRGRAYSMLVLFDGWEYTHVVPTPTILDNLYAAGHVPPLVAVMVDTTANRFRDLGCSIR